MSMFTIQWNLNWSKIMKITRANRRSYWFRCIRLTDSDVSDKLRYAMINLWPVNPKLLKTSLSLNFRRQPSFKKMSQSGHWLTNHPATWNNSSQNTKLLPSSSNLQLKNKKRLFSFPMDFVDLTTAVSLIQVHWQLPWQERIYQKSVC